MWVTKNIKFPEKLPNALKENKLVIFAGAGISMGEPSNLPSFNDLADLIAEELFVEKKKKDEPVDNYLGRLVEEGKNVKQTAAKLLTVPDSKPTSIHRDLFRLFPSKDQVKIITTNFDKHFASVIEKESYDGTKSYYAPALPLGRDFNGLVYLHGAIEDDISSLVLTDSDFGKAYLSDGWATSFLKGVFENYTVLFIGYSHNDVVMKYLARGLPPDTLRFAFTPKENSQLWEYLNITPIEYEVSIDQDGNEDHSELNSAISSWVKDVNMKPLEHEDRVKSIVNSENPLSRKDDSYLLNLIKDNSRVHFFIRNTDFDKKWLKWFSEKEVFSKKFSTSIDRGTLSMLVVWFVRECVTNAPIQSLNVILNTKHVDEGIWNPLAGSLARNVNKIDPVAFSKWLTTLIQYGSGSINKSYRGLLIRELKYPKHKESLVTLLSYILTPQVDIKSSYFPQDSDDSSYVYPKIFYDVDKYILDHVLNKILKENISELARLLLPIVTNSITHAHFLWGNFFRLNRDGDFLSARISAIEELEEKSIHEGPIDRIKDIGREIIEYFCDSDPDFSDIVIEQWYQSDIPILIRLAVHGKRLQQNCSNSDKVIWCCQRELIFHMASGHEISLLLKEKYPHSNRKAKNQLMKIVDEKISQIDPNDKEDNLPREVHRLLRMLEKVAPECNFVKKRLHRIHEIIPKLQKIPYQKEEIPRLGFQPVHDISPVSKEELKEKTPDEAVKLFNKVKKDFKNG